MEDFIPSENLSSVEQLKRSAIIATQNMACIRRALEKEPDQFRRLMLLKLLWNEMEKSSFTQQRLDSVEGLAQ